MSALVLEVIESRNMKIVEGSNLLIDLDPEIAVAFIKSTSVSIKC